MAETLRMTSPARLLLPTQHHVGPSGSQRSGSIASTPVPMGATKSPQTSRVTTPISSGRIGEYVRNLMPPADTLPACPGPTFPLNPDLPSSNVLFVFSNFASYAKAPGQGQYGVGEGGLRNATRLLEYARECQQVPRSRVHVLHLKYRADDGQGEGPPRKVTPPFPTELDPVIKIEAYSTGLFEPPPGAAVFDHIAKNIVPPPRYIVYSYVGSWLTNQQLGMLSSWCAEADPPIALLCPFETRIREDLPLELALRDGLDISMYADEEASDFASEADEEAFGDVRWSGTRSTIGAPGELSISQSQSGARYMLARQEAMRSVGIMHGGGSLRSSSYVSETGGSEDNPRPQPSKSSRLETVVDNMDLGDNGSQDNVDPGSRRRTSLHVHRTRSRDSSTGARSLSRVMSGTPPRLSHLPSQFMRQGGRDGLPQRPHGRHTDSVAFRDLVIAHMDTTDPEFVQTYVD